MANFDRKILFNATIKERYPLTQTAERAIWHITLHLPYHTLSYTTGDSLGIYPQNDPLLVTRLLKALQATGKEHVFNPRKQELVTLQTFLTCQANISRLPSSLVKMAFPDDSPPALAEYDLVLFLENFSIENLSFQQLCEELSPLLPRFYSIASSHYLQKDYVDLTVALPTWPQQKELRHGVASYFLCHIAEPDKTPIPTFVQPASHFRLPFDPFKNIIMVGPGTGIAPFRAFIQERHHQKAYGRNWLFFGERHRDSSFLYESDWANYSNLRLETAFSRDQEEKIYVQHKILENAQELHQWMEEGAYLYVCGNAKMMARDVEKTLQEIYCHYGKLEPIQAKEYIKNLKKQKRYLLDVY